MRGQRIFLFSYWVLQFVTFSDGESFSANNALNGKHLRILGLEFSTTFKMKKNATGHIIYADGTVKHMIDALAEMLNFSYSWVPHPYANHHLSFEGGLPYDRGGMSYLTNDEADYVITAILGTPTRFKNVDFPSSWNCAKFGGIIPYPKPIADIDAPRKPFSYQVWILIVIAVATVATYFHLLGSKFLRKHRLQNRANSSEPNNTISLSYVVGILISQGQHCVSKRLAIRIAAGAWCLGCFFLVQIYCSTLTSHLMAPNEKAIVNSFYEIADTPGVRIAVDKSFAIDGILILQKNNLTGFMKRLSDMLRDDPSLRCEKSIDCLKTVKDDQHVVYLNIFTTLQTMIDAELKKSNGTCDFTLMKETFWPSTHLYTALRKNSPYTETMSRGILRLRETGLINAWESRYLPLSNKCLNFNKKQEQGKSRLSLRHLSGPFAILLIGYVLSIAVFISEKIMSLFNRRVIVI